MPNDLDQEVQRPGNREKCLYRNLVGMKMAVGVEENNELVLF